MGINVNKAFVKPENLVKLDKEYFKQYSGTEEDEEVFKTELDYQIDVIDIQDGVVLLGMSSDLGYQCFNWEPKQEEILSFVEQQEALSGDLLVKVIEIVVKKLNKFKGVIESIKGL